MCICRWSYTPIQNVCRLKVYWTIIKLDQNTKQGFYIMNGFSFKW